MGLKVGLPESVTEEARRIAKAVEAADSNMHRGAGISLASEMHGGDLSETSPFRCSEVLHASALLLR